MRKSLAVFLLAAAVASLPAPALADIIPPIGLAPGSEYQLVFATADTTTPVSSDINYYNTFVQSEAALDPSLPSTTWAAVVSTATNDARVNAPNPMVGGSYLPVYNTQGIEVMPGGAERTLYSVGPTGGLSSPVGYDQYGMTAPTDVWAGSAANGVRGDYLGFPFVGFGNTTVTGTQWLNDGVNFSPASTSLSIYALSAPIVVPFTTGGGPSTVGGGEGTFSNITSPGTFSANFFEPANSAAFIADIGAAAAGSINFALPGGTWQFWDLGFTGTFTGSVTVTLHFDPSQFNSAQIADLAVEHYTNGAWVRPANQVVDTVNDTITFTTDSFSPFMLADIPSPEASSFALLGLGSLALTVVTRRRG